MRDLLPPRLLRAQLIPQDPLDLSSGAGSRLLLAGGVLALLWGAVAWAMSA